MNQLSITFIQSIFLKNVMTTANATMEYAIMASVYVIVDLFLMTMETALVSPNLFFNIKTPCRKEAYFDKKIIIVNLRFSPFGCNWY